MTNLTPRNTAWVKTGRKLKMGGCCVRFRTLQDAALEVIGEAVRRTPVKAYVENYVKALARTGRGPDGQKLKGEAGAKKVTKKTVATKVKKAAKR